MSFAPRQQPGPSRQERQSEMEAITIQQERDEEERRLRAEEEAKNKAERERLMKEQQTAALATQQAAEASAISASTTSKPTEIEETVKIKTNPITGEQTTTLEEKVPAGVPTSIGPVSPNMEGGAAPIPLTPTATAKPVRPDMEGGAAPVPMGAGTLTPTVGAPGSIPTLQDTLGAADEAGATVTPGSTPATSGVEGQAVSPTGSFTDQAKGFLEKFEPYKAQQPTAIPGVTSATLGGSVGARSGGATLRPGEMPKAVMPTMPSAPAQAPGVTPQIPGASSVVQAPKPLSTQIGTPQGGMVMPDQREVGPSVPQISGMQPVSYQVPDNDAYAMAQQQNYPMDELGNYYAPNGQVIRPGMTMADLTTASVAPVAQADGFAPTPNWTAQSGEKFVADKLSTNGYTVDFQEDDSLIVQPKHTWLRNKLKENKLVLVLIVLTFLLKEQNKKKQYYYKRMKLKVVYLDFQQLMLKTQLKQQKHKYLYPLTMQMHLKKLLLVKL